MKLRSLAVVALCLVAAREAPAQEHTGIRITDPCDDCPGRIGDRHSMREARFAIHTRGGEATLMLTRRVVAFQLSDRERDIIKHGLPEERDPEADFWTRVAEFIVRRTVLFAVDGSVEYRIRDLRSVDYRNGRLVFVTHNGRRAFQEVKRNGRDVMDAFSPDDARRFVREFRAAKGRTG